MRNRADNVRGWTIEELILILLRQFKRLLADRGSDLTDSQMRELARAAADRKPDASTVDLPAVLSALDQIVAESEALLAAWDLSFAVSLQTPMTDMPGWETTADFLSLANDKVNAELRISAGSVLRLLFGREDAIAHVLTSARNGVSDAEDVDAVIAVRALAFALNAETKPGIEVIAAAQERASISGK